MIDNYNPEDFERLKQEVETLVGRKIRKKINLMMLKKMIMKKKRKKNFQLRKRKL